MQIIKNIRLDFYGKEFVSVNAKQGDTARYVQVEIIQDNIMFSIPSGATATIACGDIWNICAITENKILAPLKGMLNKPGEKRCQIELLLDNDKLTTVSFELNVERSTRDDGAIEGSNKFSVLDQTIKDAGAATTAANTAAANANSKATLADKAAAAADTATSYAWAVSNQLLDDLDNGVFDGSDGSDGTGLNILSASNVSVTSTAYCFATLYATENIEANTDYTIVLSGNFENTDTDPSVDVYIGDGYNRVTRMNFVSGQDSLLIGTFRTPSSWAHPDVDFTIIRLYNEKSTTAVKATLKWAALYRGKIDNPSKQWTASRTELVGSQGQGLNLLTASNVPVTSASYNFTSLRTTEEIELDTEYTVVMKGNFVNSSTTPSMRLYLGDGTNLIKALYFTSGEDGTLIGTFRTPTQLFNVNVNKNVINVYNYPQSGVGSSTLNWSALYRGKIENPTNQWTPSRTELKGDPGKDGNDSGVGLNLLAGSNVPITSTAYNFVSLYATENIEPNTDYTIIMSGNFKNTGTDSKIWVYVGDAYNILIQMKFTSGSESTLIGTFKTPISFIHEDVDFTLIKFYNAPENSRVTATLNWAALYRGKISNPPKQWIASVKDINAVSADKLKVLYGIDGVAFNGTQHVRHCATCTTAASTVAKIATITNAKFYLQAYIGKVVVKFVNGNSATNPTLNVNDTGSKPIIYKGKAVPANYISPNTFLELQYDGTNWQVIGDLAQAQIDALQAELDTLNGSLTGVIVPNSQFTTASGYTNNCRLVKVGNMMSLTLDVQGNYPANTLISPIIIPAAYRPKKSIITTCSNGANVPVLGTLSIKIDGSVNAYMPSLSAAIFGNYSWTI